MNIVFDSLYIENFKSIGEANVLLKDRGIVTVVGINNYENNAKSNGSGKSSIFAALFWCLYGKTPEGILLPRNRFAKSDCKVIVRFVVDSISYEITRTCSSSQSVQIIQSGVDISCRNKSDSDKQIKDNILHMSPDIFLSLIYLSQGFSNRLSVLTPALRKERLEVLTDTQEYIDSFSDKLSNLESKYSCLLRDSENTLYSIDGQIKSLQSSISSLQKRIEESKCLKLYFEYEDIKYYPEDVQNLQVSRKNIQTQLSECMQTKSQLDSQRASLSSNKLSAESRIQSWDKENCEIQLKLRELECDSTCPTCHQTLSIDNKELLINDMRNRVNEINIAKEEESNKHNLICNQLDDINVEINDQLLHIQDFQSQISKIDYIISNIPIKSQNDTELLQDEIVSNASKIEELEMRRSDLNKSVNSCADYLNVIKHSRQLVGKQFRAYLLESAIAFLNSRLVEYSRELFSNSTDYIHMSADSQKLDILLGESTYDSLSGGERRRVDLAVTLAQKDLASEIAGIHSNIMILDEIMESMDETATNVTLSLLEKASSSLESMFIISHNNYSLPVDSQIVVTKNENQISFVSQE